MKKEKEKKKKKLILDFVLLVLFYFFNLGYSFSLYSHMRPMGIQEGWYKKA